MIQQYLGTLIGFPEQTADMRMTQYETGIYTPKKDLTKAQADALDVSPLVLSVPDSDSHFGIMHNLFTLRDCYDLAIEIKGRRFVSKIISAGKKVRPAF